MWNGTKMKSKFNKISVIAVWLGIWQAASMLTGLDLLLAGPVDVFWALCALIRTGGFYRVIGSSFAKITAGFMLAFVPACLLGVCSGKLRLLEKFLEPPVHLLKALPVTAFIILLLIWFGSGRASVWVSGMVAFPVIYTAVLEGMHRRDPKLRELSRVFGIGGLKRLCCIDWPQMMPFLSAALKTSVGFCWKAGVSAEVIGLARNSIGEQMYFAKLYLMTADLFAWSLIVVLLSVLFERLFLFLFEKLAVRAGRFFVSGRERGRKAVYSRRIEQAPEAGDAIRVSRVTKEFVGRRVLDTVSLTFARGGAYCLMGMSGTGKTTLLRLLMGLEKADAGTVSGMGSIAAVFQEDRLLEAFSAVENVCLVLPPGQRTLALKALTDVLPKTCLEQPVRELSGGMRRRVALVRALLARSDTLLLDEPFTGLDAAAKAASVRLIRAYRAGRTLLLVTHDRADAAALGATICLLTTD